MCALKQDIFLEDTSIVSHRSSAGGIDEYNCSQPIIVVAAAAEEVAATVQAAALAAAAAVSLSSEVTAASPAGETRQTRARRVPAPFHATAGQTRNSARMPVLAVSLRKKPSQAPTATEPQQAMFTGQPLNKNPQ